VPLCLCAGHGELPESDVTSSAMTSLSSPVTSQFPSLIDLHYQKLYGHLLSLAGGAPSLASPPYDDDVVDRKPNHRTSAFERYHPYLCRP